MLNITYLQTHGGSIQKMLVSGFLHGISDERRDPSTLPKGQLLSGLDAGIATQS